MPKPKKQKVSLGGDGAAAKRLNDMLRNFCFDHNQQLRNDIDLYKYSVDTGEEVTNATIQELCQLIPGIVRLDLTKCFQVSDVGMWCIASHCSDTIQHLVLADCDQLTHVGLRSISLSCAALLSLDFTNCKLLDDIAMTTIAAGCWHLRVLVLENCGRITDAGVAEIARPLGKSLQVLNLNNCTKVGDFGSRALIAIGTYCRELRLLELANCRRVEDAGLLAVANGCRKLESLRLSGCTACGGGSFKAIFEKLPHLNTIVLQNCTMLQDRDVKLCFDAVSKNNPGLRQSLTSVDISGSDRITDEGIYAVCTCLGQALYHLNIAGSNITDLSSNIVASYCGRLRSLDLSNCVNLTDDTVHCVARNVTALTSLKLDGTSSNKVTMHTVMSYVTPNSYSTDIGKYGILNSTQQLLSPAGGGRSAAGNATNAKSFAQSQPATRNVSFAALPGSTGGGYDGADADLRGSSSVGRGMPPSGSGNRITNAALRKSAAGQGRGPPRAPPVGTGTLRSATPPVDPSSTSTGELESRIPQSSMLRTFSSQGLLGAGEAGAKSGVSSVSNSRPQTGTLGALITRLPPVPTQGELLPVPQLEFAELATAWFGYKPKEGFDSLIKGREDFRVHTVLALRIQGMIRRKIAYRKYRIRRLWWLVNKILPLFQAQVRGFFQRRRWRHIQHQRLRWRCAITVQTCYRRYLMVCWREEKRKDKLYRELKQRMAALIQKMYWGWKARIRVRRVRNDVANSRLMGAKVRAKRELAAAQVQRVFRGWVARMFRDEEMARRQRRRRRVALEDRMRRLIQRIIRGKIGRIRAEERRAYLRRKALEWFSASQIERVYRGHVGRLIAKEERRLREIRRRNAAATQIQRIFRGFRGRILAAIAKALKLLRAQMNEAAKEIQRYARGYIGRNHARHYREKVERERLIQASATKIQRVFRGHKGREAREIEKALQLAEIQMQPILSHLKGLEEEALKLQRLLNRLEEQVTRMDIELVEGHKELEHCMHTTNKYTDCARINNIPQRYLTKYLRIRLKDHLEHEDAIFKTRTYDWSAKKVEMRYLQEKITVARRELVPFTTGLVVRAKQQRTKALRDRIRLVHRSVVRIQALWKGALTRWASRDPGRDHWIECEDEEQGDVPYYYNTWTQTTAWKMPMAYRYFHVEPRPPKQLTSDDAGSVGSAGTLGSMRF